MRLARFVGVDAQAGPGAGVERSAKQLLAAGGGGGLRFHAASIRNPTQARQPEMNSLSRDRNMTCHLSQTDWRDVVYNTVRNTSGGVVEAARYLTERRGRSIHPETLRARLRGTDGEWVNLEMLELLTEWMQEKTGSKPTDWLKALSHRFGMVAMELPAAPEGGWACEVSAIKQKLLQLNVEGGSLTALGMKVTEDMSISPKEAEAVSAQIMAEVELLLRLRRNVMRAAGLEAV